MGDMGSVLFHISQLNLLIQDWYIKIAIALLHRVFVKSGRLLSRLFDDRAAGLSRSFSGGADRQTSSLDRMLIRVPSYIQIITGERTGGSDMFHFSDLKTRLGGSPGRPGTKKFK